VSYNSEKDMQTAWDYKMAFKKNKEGGPLFEEASTCD
jgi:hypothetical protein